MDRTHSNLFPFNLMFPSTLRIFRLYSGYYSSQFKLKSESAGSFIGIRLDSVPFDFEGQTEASSGSNSICWLGLSDPSYNLAARHVIWQG
ncbi:hypothetical protein VTL71DRAFT_5486 [Oculimacula yallundae]|uniref:Uncharacterized protein n=1 Tax=Oculimacula yallundae TaxID=86028 RepID=A0ABR4C2E2_9HELO